MNNIFMFVKNRLKSEKGESIAEVLVATLVISLASVLIATMITTAIRIIDKAQKEFFSQVDQNYIYVTGDISVLDESDYLNISARDSGAQSYTIQPVRVGK